MTRDRVRAIFRGVMSQKPRPRKKGAAGWGTRATALRIETLTVCQSDGDEGGDGRVVDGTDQGLCRGTNVEWAS